MIKVKDSANVSVKNKVNVKVKLTSAFSPLE